MKKTIFIGALTLPLLFQMSVQAQDPVVATVNGQKITQSVLEQNFMQNQLYLSPQKVTKKKVLHDLINRQLGIEKAKKENLPNDEVVKYKMEDVLYHAQVSKDLEPLLKKIEVSDKDVQNYYDKNKEYRTAHILFRLRANPSEEEVTAAIEKALEVYEKAKKEPQKFSELANKYTQSAAAPNGGDLGFVPPPRLAPEYFAAINGKAINTITPPTRTQFGIHIIKVLAVKKYEHINQGLYKKIVYDEKRDKIMEKYFLDQQKNASIKINEELLK